jgi:hypothetical protein
VRYPLELTNDDLVDLCSQYRIRITVPLSQLEAEAAQRGVSLITIVPLHLIQHLKEVGAL